MGEYLVPLGALVGDERHHVLDRWHVGELIYGPLLRERSILSLGQAAYVELVLRTLGATFIHVTAQPETLLGRFVERGDDLIDVEQLAHVALRYDEYCGSRSHAHWFTLLTDEPHDPVDVIRLAERTRPVSLPSYVGPPDPGLLLLGDRRNPGHTPASALPWPFGPAVGTSGLWLFDALVSADVNVQRVGVLNACELSGDELRATYTTLGAPPAVTLGHNSAIAATSAGLVGFGRVEHPQHARRFHHHAQREYVTRLLDAAGVTTPLLHGSRSSEVTL
jgi:hypothetical protein